MVIHDQSLIQLVRWNVWMCCLSRCLLVHWFSYSSKLELLIQVSVVQIYRILKLIILLRAEFVQSCYTRSMRCRYCWFRSDLWPQFKYVSSLGCLEPLIYGEQNHIKLLLVRGESTWVVDSRGYRLRELFTKMPIFIYLMIHSVLWMHIQALIFSM